MKRTVIITLALLLLTMAAYAQPAPFELEAGYRWLDLKGNGDMYRSQINERSGFLIRSFMMSAQTDSIDRFRVDISDLGVGPAGSLRIAADHGNLWKLRLGYRTANAFSALPNFANPFIGQSVIPGQHTFNRTRRMLDIDVDFFNDRWISPFVGYSWNDNHGPGTTTYHFGQDEFRLAQNLTERDHEFRAGAGFHYGAISGQVLQGWRNFHSTESLSLLTGANNGNNSVPVIGQPINATDITRVDRNHVDTPFTNFYVTGDVRNRVRLVANYVHLAASGDGTELESANGSFASFAISRFFTGFNENARSAARNDTWRGGGRAEVALAPNVDFIAGFQREHRDLNGTALVDSVFLDSVLFSGADKKDVETVLNAKSSVQRNTDVFNGTLSAHAIGPFSVRGEYRESKMDVDVAPDLSEIVVPGAQGGAFSRRIRTFDTDANYAKSGLLVGLAWRRDRANEPIFRTDYTDRDRYRLRAAWKSPKDFLRVGATAERTSQNNDRPDIGYDAHVRQISGDVVVTPVTGLSFRASMSQFRADSDAVIRHPENFTLDHSINVENGKAQEGGFTFFRERFSLDGSMSRFTNRGTLPFLITRQRARVTYDLKTKAGVAFEWDRDKYDEPNPAFGYYDASRVGIYLRWRP
jgi:hypothetical protein